MVHRALRRVHVFRRAHGRPAATGLNSSGSSFGALVFSLLDSDLGRAGVRIGTTYVVDRFELALQPFVTGSVWREFAGDTHTTFETGANYTQYQLTVTRVGTFGQVGVGVSGQVLKTGLLGFVARRLSLSATTSAATPSVAGMRYQFCVQPSLRILARARALCAAWPNSRDARRDHVRSRGRRA